MAQARLGFRRRWIVIAALAVAMAYVEAAVVVYLRHALSIDPAELFPLREPASLGDLGPIEFGREAATLVMLCAVGWLGGRTGLARLAWGSVAFGLWDVAYYGWLWIFSGWPPSLGTWDLLFLIPVPWVSPVWAPLVVSAALIGFGSARCAVWRRAGSSRSAGFSAQPHRPADCSSSDKQPRSRLPQRRPGDRTSDRWTAGGDATRQACSGSGPRIGDLGRRGQHSE